MILMTNLFLLMTIFVCSLALGDQCEFGGGNCAYKAGDLLTLAKDKNIKILPRGKLASWCPGTWFDGLYDVAAIDPKIPQINLTTSAGAVELSNTQSTLNFKTLTCTGCSLELHKGQRLLVAEASSDNVLQTVASHGECGRYYFVKVEILDKNNLRTGNIVTMVTRGPADRKNSPILDFLQKN